MKPQGFVPETASPSAHEPSDIHPSTIARMAGLLGFVLVASAVLVALLFGGMERTHPARTSEAAPRVSVLDLPPNPRLQVDPLRDLQAVRAAEDENLTHYNWIDHQHGIAQIPVNRAMVLWVKNYSTASPSAVSGTNAPSAAGTTELQMRQLKAREDSHAP